MKKSLLSIAIIAALPLTAHATDPVVGPAHANSGAVVATASAPYVTFTPTADDATHIASTAYVKGAYNDAIAAVNNVANDVSGKQTQLVNYYNNVVYNKVLPGYGRAGVDGVGAILALGSNDDVNAMLADMANELSDGQSQAPDEVLASLGATFRVIRETTQWATDMKRVKVYTTWDDDRDSATTEVAFVNAQ